MKIISISQIPEGELSFNWIEDGILCGKFTSQLFIDLETAKEAVTSRAKFAGRKSYPFLVEECTLRTMSSQAREYFVSGEGTSNIRATAIMATSLIGCITGNLYLAFKKQTVPVRFFTDRKEAKKWLGRFQQTELTIAAQAAPERNDQHHISYA